MKKLGIVGKIALLTNLIVLMNVLIIVLLLVNYQSSVTTAKKIYEQNLLSVQYTSSFDATLAKTRTNTLYTSLYSSTPSLLNHYVEEVNSCLIDLQKNYELMKSIESIDQKKIKLLGDYIDEYKASGEQVLAFRLEGKDAEAMAYEQSHFTPIDNQFLSPLIEEILTESINQASLQYTNVIEDSKLMKKLFFTIFSIGVTIIGVLIIYLMKTLVFPFKAIAVELSKSIRQISNSTDLVARASVEISNGVQEQASGIQETSATMEELTSMVKQNLLNIKQCSVLSDQASIDSNSGFEKMSNMITAMQSISTATENIKSVISVIDDISFQTNMLALNAAVEAARAGELGLGFAVVADEVKNLASRSSNSAKETATMIKTTIENVNQGSSLSTEMSDIFSLIMENSKKVKEMNQEIENASIQQDEGIDQINTALVQFDKAVQQNAAQSEETASAATELQGQVNILAELSNKLNFLVSGGKAVNVNKKQGDIEKPKERTPSKTSSVKKVEYNDKKSLPKPKTKMIEEKKPTITTGVEKQADDDKPSSNLENDLTQNKKATEITKPVENQRHIISFEDDEEFSEM